MSHIKTIGVLGGMGPEATILLQQRILAAVDAKDDRDHIPLLVDMNPQVPSRIDYLLKGTGPNPATVLGQMAKRLEVSGAKALAMPCNTAHLFANDIEAAVEIPLLNMIDFVVEAVFRQVGRGGKVGVLASPATKETGLFSQAFAIHEIETLYPRNQTALLEAIQAIKSSGASTATKNILVEAGRDVEQQGAMALLIGCSEFSMIADGLRDTPDVKVVCIDALDVLVREIVKFSQL
ncbi:MAG: aspartate/glutamate racemase family protein [Alphaproteobacteria bacterium]